MALNSTAPSRSSAATPATGAPLRQTTRQSIVIVRERPSSATATVPDVPAGATMVSVNEELRCPRRQRETTAPARVGIRPCAHSTFPGWGAMIHAL